MQVEARRASRAHAEQTLERRDSSNRRLQERVAARAKAKQSRCLQTCPEFASLDDASVGTIVDAMEYRVVEGGPGTVVCAEGARWAVASLMFSVNVGEPPKRHAYSEADDGRGALPAAPPLR